MVAAGADADCDILSFLHRVPYNLRIINISINNNMNFLPFFLSLCTNVPDHLPRESHIHDSMEPRAAIYYRTT